MRGVIGENLKGSYIKYELDDFEGKHHGLLKSHPSSSISGYFSPVDTTINNVCIRISTITSKLIFKATRNLTFPKVKIYTGLAVPSELAVPEFFIEEHLEFLEVVLPMEKKNIAGKTVNDSVAPSKLIKLGANVTISYVAGPMIQTALKETEIGDIKIFKKRIVNNDF